MQVVSGPLSPGQCREAMKARIHWPDAQWIDAPIYACREEYDIGSFSSVRAPCPTLAAVSGNPDRVQASLVFEPETPDDALQVCDFAASLDAQCSRWFVATRRRPVQPPPADPLDELGVMSQLGRTGSPMEDGSGTTFYCLGPETGLTLRPRNSSAISIRDTNAVGHIGRIATNGHRFGPFAEPIEVIDLAAGGRKWLPRQEGLRCGVHRSFNSAKARFGEMLAWSESGPIVAGWLFLEFPIAAYEAVRARLDAFASGWEVYVEGALHRRVKPFAERASTQDGAPEYIPLYAWLSHQPIVRHPWRVRESFACAVLRTPEGLRLEFCTDTDDAARLLDAASGATGGLEFTLVEPDGPRSASG